MLVEYVKQRSNKMISFAVQKPGLLSPPPLVLPQLPLQSNRKLTRTTTYWNTIGNYGVFVFVVCLFLSCTTTKGLRISLSGRVLSYPVQGPGIKPQHFYHNYVFINPFSCWCYIPSSSFIQRHLKYQQDSSGSSRTCCQV